MSDNRAVLVTTSQHQSLYKAQYVWVQIDNAVLPRADTRCNQAAKSLPAELLNEFQRLVGILDLAVELGIANRIEQSFEFLARFEAELD